MYLELATYLTLLLITQGEAELCILELTSVFHHLSSVGPKQLCALANLDCTCEVGAP